VDESPVTDVGLGDGGGVVLDDDCAGGVLPAAGMVAAKTGSSIHGTLIDPLKMICKTVNSISIWRSRRDPDVPLSILL